MTRIMRKLTEYVLALTHLYGLVHKDKVMEIYTLQNDEPINEDAINAILRDGVNEGFVGTHGAYFVHETILENGSFDSQLAQRRGKPFYTPEQDELLRYVDDYYYEKSHEFHALEEYAAERLFDGDRRQAENLADDIQGVCQYAFSAQMVMATLNRRNVNFRNEQQLSEVMQLIMELANNTRLW